MTPFSSWAERAAPRTTLRARALRQLWVGEPHLRFLQEWIDDRIAIDVGANVGVYSFHLHRLGARVIAVEPHPELQALLARSLPRRVRLVPMALGEACGWADLHVPDLGSRSRYRGTIEPGLGSRAGGTTFTVEVRTLDEIADGPVGFVKIDVEGHEPAVLRGGNRILTQDRPVILVEADDRVREGSASEIDQLLRTHDYRQLNGAWNENRGRWRNVVYSPSERMLDTAAHRHG